MQWLKQERMGGGRGYLGAKAQDFWTVWQGRPKGPAGGTPSHSTPSANTGYTESKMVWLQALGVLLPGWRTSPTAPASPHAAAKERPEEDKAEREQTALGGEPGAHGVRGAKGSEGCWKPLSGQAR